MIPNIESVLCAKNKVEHELDAAYDVLLSEYRSVMDSMGLVPCPPSEVDLVNCLSSGGVGSGCPLSSDAMGFGVFHLGLRKLVRFGIYVGWLAVPCEVYVVIYVDGCWWSLPFRVSLSRPRAMLSQSAEFRLSRGFLPEDLSALLTWESCGELSPENGQAHTGQLPPLVCSFLNLLIIDDRVHIPGN